MYETANLHPPLSMPHFLLALLLPAQIATMGTLHGGEAPRTWLVYPLCRAKHLEQSPAHGKLSIIIY